MGDNINFITMKKRRRKCRAFCLYFIYIVWSLYLSSIFLCEDLGLCAYIQCLSKYSQFRYKWCDIRRFFSMWWWLDFCTSLGFFLRRFIFSGGEKKKSKKNLKKKNRKKKLCTEKRLIPIGRITDFRKRFSLFFSLGCFFNDFYFYFFRFSFFTVALIRLKVGLRRKEKRTGNIFY